MIRKLGALVVGLTLLAVRQASGQEAFWRKLGDTTLVRLVAEVVQSNNDVVAGRARVQGARAARLDAALDFAPAVTATASFTRQRLSSAAFPGTFAAAFPDQNVWDAGLQP